MTRVKRETLAVGGFETYLQSCVSDEPPPFVFFFVYSFLNQNLGKKTKAFTTTKILCLPNRVGGNSNWRPCCSDAILMVENFESVNLLFKELRFFFNLLKNFRNNFGNMGEAG